MNQRGAKLNRKLMRVGMAILFSFLSFFIFFPADHIASPGRTLIIINNTNATLFVLNQTRWSRTARKFKDYISEDDLYEAANIKIPPLSRKSLFNFLDKNNNIIYFYPKLIRPTQKYFRRYRAVYVTGEETYPKVLNIYPKDFGKHFMSDAPGVSK